ncbi:MAG TPA: hypothetical protein VEO56_07475 [Bacteroidota bacterium]|nr:hypothetical protein [Bacteroidota bacterium]
MNSALKGIAFAATILILARPTGALNAQTSDEKTTLGGYGSAMYQRDFNLKDATVDLERVVLFIGHDFSRKVSLVSELEMEDAKVSGGEPGGEIAFEQAYVKFALNADHSLVAGLFLPRIGILNEEHLPTSFNGNERTQVETYILPSTWRELGVGMYGRNDLLPLTWSFALVNGLNAAGFTHGSLIREGRFEGRNASANNLALTGALQYFQDQFRVQLSGYYGGTVGLPAAQAESLKLSPGPFGTPVVIGEADASYEISGFSFRLLGTLVSIPDAEQINQAYSNNTPRSAYGFYAEGAYNLLWSASQAADRQLVVFLRLEKLDMNSSVPANGISDGTLRQVHLIGGLGYFPLSSVVIKADVRFVTTGSPSEVILPVGFPSYQTSNTFLNVGIGFSF